MQNDMVKFQIKTNTIPYLTKKCKCPIKAHCILYGMSIWEAPKSRNFCDYIFLKSGSTSNINLRYFWYFHSLLTTNSVHLDEMQHNTDFIRVFTVCKDKKYLQTKDFENFNRTPLDINNGLSQVYCIKPEGRIH